MVNIMVQVSGTVSVADFTHWILPSIGRKEHIL